MEIESYPLRRKRKEELKNLYESSFPQKERTPFSILMLRCKSKMVNLLIFTENNNMVGFSYLIKKDRHLLILYLAVKEDLRDKGYGSRILYDIKRNTKIMQ